MALRRTLTAVMALMLLASACSSSGTDTGGSDTNPATATTAPAATTTDTSDRPAATAPPTTSTGTAAGAAGNGPTLIEVLDGDTIQVDDDGVREEVVLLGINAPERRECYGRDAAEALATLIGEGPLTLEAAGPDRDSAGRLLRYVSVDGDDVNLKMVQSGNALGVAVDHPRLAEFRAAYDEAWQSRNGMWFPAACGDSAPPLVRILDFTSDPPGRDRDDLNGEWVEIHNRDQDMVDLSGWILRDESTALRYLVPDGTTLASDATLRIHVGCGADTATALYWCQEAPVFDNRGDSVILMDAAGNTAGRIAYDGIGF